MRKTGFTWPANRNTPVGREFWAGLKKKKLLASKCRSCGEVFFPPRFCCPACLGNNLDWFELSGKGTLYSWTEVFFAGPAFNTPFLLGLIDLAEGVGRIVSRITGVKAGELEIGMPVRFIFVDVQEDFTIYCATPDAI